MSLFAPSSYHSDLTLLLSATIQVEERLEVNLGLRKIQFINPQSAPVDFVLHLPQNGQCSKKDPGERIAHGDFHCWKQKITVAGWSVRLRQLFPGKKKNS